MARDAMAATNSNNRHAVCCQQTTGGCSSLLRSTPKAQTVRCGEATLGTCGHSPMTTTAPRVHNGVGYHGAVCSGHGELAAVAMPRVQTKHWNRQLRSAQQLLGIRNTQPDGLSARLLSIADRVHSRQRSLVVTVVGSTNHNSAVTNLSEFAANLVGQ